MKTEIQKLDIAPLILTIRGLQVILDRDIASLYGIQTKVLNQSVKRNLDRFPSDFAFRLSEEELKEVVTNCDRLKILKHTTTPPFAFTELGVTMMASIISSDTAIRISIEVVRVFVALNHQYQNGHILISRISKAEQLLIDHSRKIDTLSNIYQDIVPKNQGIFFNDQIFDAYVFSCNLIQKAQSSIVLIDNYVDESTLLQLSKRKPMVTAHIFTEKITPQHKLDLQKHNAQYPNISIKSIKKVHDRFLIIDNKELYHLGASLKDLGKKWFAFSRIDSILPEILSRL